MKRKPHGRPARDPARHNGDALRASWRRGDQPPTDTLPPGSHATTAHSPKMCGTRVRIANSSDSIEHRELPRYLRPTNRHEQGTEKRKLLSHRRTGGSQQTVDLALPTGEYQSCSYPAQWSCPQAFRESRQTKKARAHSRSEG